MTTTLDAATTDTIDRLSDLEGTVWSRDEIALNLQDGYDILCTRTGALFDIAVIENVPIAGNWQTDLERYHASQRPGWGLTDEPFHMTGEHERNLGVGGRVGGTYRGPANITSPTEGAYAPQSVVPGGTLPDSTIDVLRVSYNQRGLVGLSSAQMRELDPQYEERVGGDPSFYVMDKDGLSYLRLVPPGQGNAAYDTISGSWGTRTYRCDEADATVTGTATLPTAAKVVVVDGVTYTFIATVASAGQVKIAATTVLTLANLANCINKSGGTEGAGGDYMAPSIEGTAAAHPRVEATSADLVLTLTQRDDLAVGLAGGVAGEAFTLTTDEATFTLSAATFDSDPTDTVVTTEVTGRTTGGFGILRHVTGDFPAGGPWGTPTRIHPEALNTTVEITRLGRDLATYHFEIPEAYVKYVIFYAMSRALRRDGPGQDLTLAEHYEQRFEQGVYRLDKRVQNMVPERRGAFGSGELTTPFGLGDPQPPPAYGVSR